MSYIARYEPRSLLNEVNQVIEQAFSPFATADTSKIETSQWVPAVDIKEEKNQFVIFADLPGVEKDVVNISMENNILTIKGERSNVSVEERKDYHREERVRGSFYRRFTLPDTADGSRIEAKMKWGVLEIVIPKKEIAQARVIKIQMDE